MSGPINLCSSNQLEALHSRLAQHLKAAPLADPFTQEIILIPSRAMARWVNLHLGLHHGIAANIDYLLPAQWVWHLASHATPDAVRADDPLSRERIAWQVTRVLPGLLSGREFQPLRRYLSDDASGVKAWQLAQRLADLFDRYQYYRPHWIRAWSAGEFHAVPEVPAWQPLLWHAISSPYAGQHRVALIDALLSALTSDPSALPVPARVSVFALSSLPPLFVQVMAAVSAHCEVTLYQLSPTDQYWADLRSKKAQARARVSHPLEAAYFDNGNELLASWGRQGQAFQDLLLSHDLLENSHWEHYVPAGSGSLLHRVQNDMLALEAGSAELAPEPSIAVHVCHSPLRECQVLHDHILAALEADRSLTPEDILVLVPEISRYAPYLDAVFRCEDTAGRPFVPWNLSDIRLADEHPLILSFFALLQLPSSRLTFSEIASLLDVPRIAAAFSLERERAQDILGLLQAAGIRWGADAAHKERLSLPPHAQNSWEHGLDRLLAGYAMGEGPLWQGIASVPGAQGSDAQSLGQVCLFLERVRHWQSVLDRPRRLLDWQRTVNELLAAFFAPLAEEEDTLQQIRDAMKDMVSLAPEQEVSLGLLIYLLQDALENTERRGRYFSGGVTVCGLRPMRGVPFRMICMLGMNDAAFPRRDQRPAFDAMAGKWVPGDPSKADEDRTVMLETVLSARERLYFSYTGRSQKDNSPLQPSVLLREFLDFLDAHFVPAGHKDTTMSACLRVEHPLQAFHWRQYVATPEHAAVASYDAWWCRIAQTLQAHSLDRPRAESSWPTVALPFDPLPEQLDLHRLLRFLQHPVKAFFTHRLGISLQEETLPEDEEVFDLTGLDAWAIRQELIECALRSQPEDADTLQATLIARGQLPHGALAQESFAAQQELAGDMLARLDAFRGFAVRVVGVTLDCALGPEQQISLTGQVQRYRPGLGILHLSASSLKPKHRLALWLEHLALCAAEVMTPQEASILISKEETLRFSPVAPDVALACLSDYARLYVEGLTRPLPLFPSASYPLAGEPDGKAFSNARRAWEGNDFNSIQGDRDDAYIALVHRALSEDPLSLAEHLSLARRVYAPLREREEIQ